MLQEDKIKQNLINISDQLDGKEPINDGLILCSSESRPLISQKSDKLETLRFDRSSYQFKPFKDENSLEQMSIQPTMSSTAKFKNHLPFAGYISKSP